MKSCVFSKHLQAYAFPELAKALKSIGIEGADLTVREGGHVEPAEVRDKLPEAVATLKAGGVGVPMITTEITSVDEPNTRAVIETAAKLGIPYYKLGYYEYRGYGNLKKQLAEAKAALRELAALSKELGICAGFHNHSNDHVGAFLPHVAQLIGDLDPKAVCAYYDIGHATVEGMGLGWLQGFDELSPRIRMIALKDVSVNPQTTGRRTQVVPMGTGPVMWDEFVKVLKAIEKQIGPVSYHGEYKDRSPEEVLKLIGEDKKFFEKHWGRSF
ncbi:MAG: TIM barrel protein [Planctomycetota bacterium]